MAAGTLPTSQVFGIYLRVSAALLLELERAPTCHEIEAELESHPEMQSMVKTVFGESTQGSGSASSGSGNWQDRQTSSVVVKGPERLTSELPAWFSN